MTRTSFGVKNFDMRFTLGGSTRFLSRGVFDPNSINGLLMWLDADDASTITVTSSPDVDSWTDKSPNAFVFSQGTAAAKPHTGTTINGRNAITFDGVDDFLTNTADVGSFDGSRGILFAVVRITSETDSKYFFGSSDEASTSRFLGFQIFDGSGDNEPIRFVQRNADVTDIVEGDDDLDAGVVYLITMKSSGTAYSARLDGVDQTMNTTNGTNNGDWFADTDARDNVTVGALMRTTLVLPLDGDICEMLYYDDVELTAGEVGQVEAYLATKWGVSI